MRSVPRLLAVTTLPLFLGTVACTRDADVSAEPMEPWRVDEAPGAALVVDRRLSLVMAPDQWLDFSVKGREVAVTGRVPLHSAHLELDPQALEHARGELFFALDRLEVRDGAGAILPEETAAARRALGLGARAPDGEQKRNRVASYRIGLGRDLSARAAHRGQLVKTEDGRTVRRVWASVEGELEMRGLVVHHGLRLRLDFVYPAAASGPEVLPNELRVRLLQPEPVSLGEHEIGPRDDAGHVIAVQLEEFRKKLSGTAQVSGEIMFRGSAP